MHVKRVATISHLEGTEYETYKGLTHSLFSKTAILFQGLILYLQNSGPYRKQVLRVIQNNYTKAF